MKKAILIVMVAMLVTLSLSLFAEAKEYKGYISDNACGMSGKDANGVDIEHAPWKNTLACMKVKSCLDSGYGMYMLEGKKWVFYTFDNKGSDMAKNEIILKTKKPSNIMVKVMGSKDDKTKMLTITKIAMYEKPKAPVKAEAKPAPVKK